MRKSKGRTLKERVLGGVAGITLGLASLFAGARAEAENFDTKNYDFDKVQEALSDPKNEVYLGEGTFEVPYGSSFNVYAKIFSGAGLGKTIIKGEVLENDVAMRIYGSDITISKMDITGFATGFIVKGKYPDNTFTKYNNILFDEVKFDGLSEWSGIWENYSSDSGDPEKTAPSIMIDNSVVNSSSGFGRSSLNLPWTNKSPFPGIDHTTIRGLTTGALADICVIDGKTRGDDFFTNIAMEDGKAIIKKELWDYTSTPNMIRQQVGVTDPLTPDTYFAETGRTLLTDCTLETDLKLDS
ncbi:MAG TPA: hypothetical protein VMZ91_01165, partial [Candidatus Paceibacterota bacterium]|nr:hypothetical protein [Candidatus Paceibacterota bacterium]